VANSLYYIHLDQASDDHLAAGRHVRHLGSARTSEDSNTVNTQPPLPNIHRKPLPPTAKVSGAESNPAASVDAPAPDPPVAPSGHASSTGTFEQGPPMPPRPVQQPPEQSWVPPGFRMENMPALESSARPPTTTMPAQPVIYPSPHQGMPPIARKPLGPRPMERPPTPEKDLPRPPLPERPNDQRQLHEYHAPLSQTPPQTNLLPDESTPDSHPRISASMMHSASPYKRETSPKFVPFTLTLIRRDPVSGNQWNVGKVASHQLEEPPATSPEQDSDVVGWTSNPRGQPMINVHLETSGYAKFRGFPTKQGIEGYTTSNSSLPKSASTVGPGEGQSNDPWKSDVDGGFNRQVTMAYGKSWTSNIKDAFRKRSNSGSLEEAEDPSPFDALEPPKRPPGKHGREGSVASIHSAGSRASEDHGDKRGSPPLLITKPGPGLKAKGYFFMSPWDGRCEFRTGNGGRSLKCRHVLTNNSNVTNPLVLAQALRDGQGLGGAGRSRSGSMTQAITGSVPVSELRFNLPSADLFRSSHHKHGGSKDLHVRFDRFLNLEARGGDNSDEDDDGGYDMNLGRERAGGGNRGKRAKLGKLIIHDEGLKMLDLVVACNVGIWWGAWERSF